MEVWRCGVCVVCVDMGGGQCVVCVGKGEGMVRVVEVGNLNVYFDVRPIDFHVVHFHDIDIDSYVDIDIDIGISPTCD